MSEVPLYRYVHFGDGVMLFNQATDGCLPKPET